MRLFFPPSGLGPFSRLSRGLRPPGCILPPLRGCGVNGKTESPPSRKDRWKDGATASQIVVSCAVLAGLRAVASQLQFHVAGLTSPARNRHSRIRRCDGYNLATHESGIGHETAAA